MGFFDKLKKITTNLFSGFTEADEAFFEELEESLILADLGLDTAMDAVEKLRVRVRKEKLQDQESVKAALRDVLAEEMAVGETALNLSTKPSVVLFIGVNGVGKTTSIGKLAHRLKGEGKRVLLCAADTFRAAAADQLQIWAERAGCELVRQHEGADPGAVLFDALQAAKARNVDVVLCDTAGRLHNKANLMAELHKLSKIIDRECPGCARETLLVLDATTGQNGLIQARTFQETAGLTGIVLTKLDGTAKGGIVVAIAKELGVPVKLAGVGESLEDLRPSYGRGMPWLWADHGAWLPADRRRNGRVCKGAPDADAPGGPGRYSPAGLPADQGLSGVVLCQVQKAHRLLGAGKCRGRAGAGIPGKPVAENMVAAAAFCTSRMTDKKERAT